MDYKEDRSPLTLADTRSHEIIAGRLKHTGHPGAERRGPRHPSRGAPPLAAAVGGRPPGRDQGVHQAPGRVHDQHRPGRKRAADARRHIRAGEKRPVLRPARGWLLPPR
ncbi:MAG: hypothetical protein MZV70_68305 [Desulfobacterales bacterium]|nr:hypothetical protein [Desulfobacterales bacterium]